MERDVSKIDQEQALHEIQSAAVAGEVLVRTQYPDRVYGDRGFLMRVVRRLFQRNDVAEAWLAARGESWLPEVGEQ